jgi:hypothetical protein
MKPTLPIGTTCRWYRRGDTTRKPLAAIVTDSDASGILDLTVFVRQGRQVEPVTGVRHKDDPYLADHPEIASENGVWDFVESVGRPAAESKPSKGR